MLSLVVCSAMQACVHTDCRLCGTLVVDSCVWNINECLSTWRELVVTLGNSGNCKYTKSLLAVLGMWFMRCKCSTGPIVIYRGVFVLYSVG